MEEYDLGSLRWTRVKLESKERFFGPRQDKTKSKPKLRQVINDNIAGLLRRTRGDGLETRNDYRGKHLQTSRESRRVMNEL